jgi:hypothetical protein
MLFQKKIVFRSCFHSLPFFPSEIYFPCSAIPVNGRNCPPSGSIMRYRHQDFWEQSSDLPRRRRGSAPLWATGAPLCRSCLGLAAFVAPGSRTRSPLELAPRSSARAPPAAAALRLELPRAPTLLVQLTSRYPASPPNFCATAASALRRRHRRRLATRNPTPIGVGGESYPYADRFLLMCS